MARAFRSPAAFRAWLATHHASATELEVRCYKTHAAARGVTYRQALDEALCLGWIDGVRRRLDDDSFSVRFSPRKAKSKWSAVNLRRFGELEAEGRVAPPGLAAFRARAGTATAAYSYESEPLALSVAYQRQLRANTPAWRFFQAQPPWYRRTSQFWVMSAKQETTRDRRLAILIDCCAAETTIPPLTRAPLRPRARSR